MTIPLVGRYAIGTRPASNLYVASRPVASGPRFRPHAAEYLVVSFWLAGEQRKGCMVRFRKCAATMEVFVQLGYFRHSFGMLGPFTLVGPAGASQTLKLSMGGRSTTRLVKYDHPADGRAHFSQDVRIKPFFTRSTPLRAVRGLRRGASAHSGSRARRATQVRAGRSRRAAPHPSQTPVGCRPRRRGPRRTPATAAGTPTNRRRAG